MRQKQSFQISVYCFLFALKRIFKPVSVILRTMAGQRPVHPGPALVNRFKVSLLGHGQGRCGDVAQGAAHPFDSQ